MASVLDVAAYILKKMGALTTWKLQKLVYYSQAWHLVWEEEPLFSEEIQAWANGPVVPALYQKHRGEYAVSQIPDGNASNLTKRQKESIDVVLERYGNKSSHFLSDLTHQERPWQNARDGIAPGERSENVISIDSMAEYYESL